MTKESPYLKTNNQTGANAMTTKTDKTYNGWTNYETWNVKLWIDNSQSTQEYWRFRALNWIAISRPDNYFTLQENAINDLRDELKEEFEKEANIIMEIGKASASCFTDLLYSALSEVNWHEIAESIIVDTQES